MAAEQTVRDYVTLIRGVTYKGDLVGKPGPALLGLGSIHPGGGFREGDYKTYGGDCPPKLMLTPGDLFVSLKGATKDGKMIGSVARVPASVTSGRLTQDTVKLEFRDAERAQASSYLYWLLRTPQYRAYCEGRAMGSAVVALSRDDFLDFPVPLFSDARKGIVEVLERIENKIELNRRMNATLEAMARALFQSWFVDFDPVRAKLDGRQPVGLDPETASLFPDTFQESSLGHIPTGWAVGRVADLSEFSRSTINPSRFSDEVFDHYSLPAFDDGRTPKVELGSAIMSNKLVVSQDCVLLSKLNPHIPRIWLPDLHPSLRSVCSTEFIVASSRTGYSREFLLSLFTSDAFASTYCTLVTGTTGSHQRIRPESVLDMTTVIPPAALVKAFTAASKPMLDQIRRNIVQSSTLATLRDALLPRLLGGELVVPLID
jgi:restriction endonuclease S subunit